MDPETAWRRDVVLILREKLKDILLSARLGIGEGIKILKDVNVIYELDGYKLHFNFFDQDIVIFTNLYFPIGQDLVEEKKRQVIKFHNTKDKSSLVLPYVIIELKYSSVVSHSVITYSQIAQDIKGIFPFCKYYMLIRFTDHTMNTLKRHGRFLDDIIKLDGPSNKKNYIEGEFQKNINSNPILSKRFDNFVSQIKNHLDKISFTREDNIL